MGDRGAGLGDYWLARKISAATDWHIQVEPITTSGGGYFWGNDRFWFTHDVHDQTRRPSYRFILMDGLPVGPIAVAYGHPDASIHCDSTLVWLYNDPNRVYNALRDASAPLATTFEAAPRD